MHSYSFKKVDVTEEKLQAVIRTDENSIAIKFKNQSGKL